MTPTARTLAEYRKRGYMIGAVERWSPHTNRRHDLFGFIDLIACGQGEIVAIQATTTSNLASRATKIKTDPEVSEAARRWLQAGGRIVVIGWRKYAKAVDRKFWRHSARRIAWSNNRFWEFPNVAG